jgi:hypothetical protein
MVMSRAQGQCWRGGAAGAGHEEALADLTRATELDPDHASEGDIEDG